jgi:hypothetical protein
MTTAEFPLLPNGRFLPFSGMPAILSELFT